jgi:hypothetical protein
MCVWLVRHAGSNESTLTRKVRVTYFGPDGVAHVSPCKISIGGEKAGEKKRSEGHHIQFVSAPPPPEFKLFQRGGFKWQANMQLVEIDAGIELNYERAVERANKKKQGSGTRMTKWPAGLRVKVEWDDATK